MGTGGNFGTNDQSWNAGPSWNAGNDQSPNFGVPAFGGEQSNGAYGSGHGGEAFGQGDTGFPSDAGQTQRFPGDHGQSAPAFGSSSNVGGFDNSGGAFGDNRYGDAQPPLSKKEERRRRRQQEQQNQEQQPWDNGFESRVDSPKMGSPSHLGSQSRLDSGFDFSKPSRGRHDPYDDQSPDFGQRSRRELPSPPRHEAPPIEDFEVLIEADKIILQSLRRDVDELDDELTRLEEACRFEERETMRERVECDRIGQEREHLTQQLSAAQRQLSELKEDHEGIVLENVMLRCDHDHFSKEASFLKRLLDEGTRDAQALQQSIEYLEQSNTSLRAHTKTLEEARREVLNTVNVEKDLLRKEQNEAEFAKQALDSLKTDGVDGLMHLSSMRPNGDLRPLQPTAFPDGAQRPTFPDGAQRPRGAVENGPGSGLGPSSRGWNPGLSQNGYPASGPMGNRPSGGSPQLPINRAGV
jgi:hypothetical protein